MTLEHWFAGLAIVAVFVLVACDIIGGYRRD